MIIGLEGGLGSGKTIGALRYLMHDYLNGHPITANIDIYGIEYEEFKLDDFLNKEKNTIELDNVSILLDEIQIYVDCRTSASKRNRLFSYFVLQTRKRNVTLYYTTQDFDMIEKRLFNFTAIQIMCEKLFAEDYPELAEIYGIDHEDNSILDIRKYVIFDFRNKKHPRVYTKIIDVSKYYDYYDTDQKILPI